MKKRVKNTFSLHHWCGLIAGIFLLAISISGSLLVFHDELDDNFYARGSFLDAPAQSLRIDRSFDKVRAANPGWEIRVPGLPESDTKALKYELRQGMQRKWVYVHPETGEWLHTYNRADKRLTQVLLEMHYTLFAGTFGKVLVLLTGLALLVLTITGFMLYRKSILKVLLFRQKISVSSKRAFFSSLHRVIGVWSLLFVLLMSISGVWLGYLVVNSALKKKSATVAVPALPVSVDALLGQVRQQHPDFEVTYLRFPNSPDGALSVLGRLQNDPAVYGKFYSGFQINYKTGAVEKVVFVKDAPIYERALTILKPLHFGDYAGLPVKILYCFFGLMPGVLSVSGFFIWRMRGKTTKQKKRKQKENKVPA
ncbi:MAG: PepSY domain-containing protein [Hymenobacteraceae bacterium]|nr:PepSY domain-containing protein [Hymenobacteraceae bacterium]